MEPDRKIVIGDDQIEEYYWAGKMVCYVNHRLSERSFDEEVGSRGQEER